MLYGVVIRANVLALPYDLVALVWMFHKLSGPWMRVYVLGKARLARPHVAFEGEIVRLFARVRRVDGLHSRLRSPGVSIIVANGKR